MELKPLEWIVSHPTDHRTRKVGLQKEEEEAEEMGGSARMRAKSSRLG